MKRSWPVLLLSWVVVGACGSVPQTHYYVLATSKSLEGVASAVDPSRAVGVETVGIETVGVETFTVDPPYDQGLLVYRLGTDSVEVGFYDYHRWASPLGALAAAAFADSANEPSGGVVFEPATADGRYAAILRGRVVYLEEVDYPDGQVVRIALELSLDDAAGEPIWQRTLSSETKILAPGAAQVVEQLRADFSELVKSARSEIVAVLPAA